MKIETRLFTLEINYLIFLVVPFVFISGYIEEYLITYSAILVHEASHFFAAGFCKKKIKTVRILPVGFNVDIEHDADSRWKHIIIYVSGPAANIFLFVVLLLIDTCYFTISNYMRFFIMVNISLAIFNLLPVKPLDGGRIIYEVVEGKVGLFLAAKYMNIISIMVCVLLVLTGIIQMIINHHNFSLIFIGIFILFTVKKSRAEAALMNIKRIIYRRSRILKKGMYPARDLVVIKSMYLGETVKGMDFDRFHIIYVLDNDLRIIGVFTEQEVFEGVLNSKGDITFEELMSRNSK